MYGRYCNVLSMFSLPCFENRASYRDGVLCEFHVHHALVVQILQAASDTKKHFRDELPHVKERGGERLPQGAQVTVEHERRTDRVGVMDSEELRYTRILPSQTSSEHVQTLCNVTAILISVLIKQF